MNGDIKYGVLDKTTGSAIQLNDLMAKYKIYAREVIGIDLTQQGGFALPSKMLKQRFSNPNISFAISAHASGLNPVVLCCDKREHDARTQSPTKPVPVNPASYGFFASQREYSPVTKRLGVLLMPVALNGMEYGVSVPAAGTSIMAYDEVIIRIFECPGYVPVAAYTDNARMVVSGNLAKVFEAREAHSNPYFTIANDLQLLIEAGVLSLKEIKSPAIANLTKSVHVRDSIHGKFWCPPDYDFIGEIAGIVLFQTRKSAYAQPDFIAEPILRELDNVPDKDELENLLALAKDQAERFAGMKAEMEILQSVIEARLTTYKKALG
jgi:hypothetical protein